MAKTIKVTYVEKYPLPVDEMPTQHLIDKLARSSGFQVMQSKYDKDKNSFIYQVMINANKSEIREIPYEEACKIMHWKSFKFIKNDYGYCETVKYSFDYDWLKPISNKKTKTVINDVEDEDRPRLSAWKDYVPSSRNRILDGI